MAKNIVIAEGTQGKTFTGVTKLKSALQGGGTQNWIPEDEAGSYVSLKSKTITQNGEYLASADNATGYKNVKVNVKPNVGAIGFEHNGTYKAEDEGLDGFSQVTVKVEGGGSNLGTKRIKANGIYKAKNDGFDGYASVSVAIGGVAPNFGKMVAYGAVAKMLLKAGNMTGGVE